MIVGERGLSRETVQRMKAGGGPVCHADGHGAVQSNNGRGAELKQVVIEKHDLLPVGIRRGLGSRMTRNDGRLQPVTSGAATQLLRPLEGGQAALNLRLVP